MPGELERAAAMAKLNDEETRSLEVLARDPDGCAEAVLLTGGFTIKQLSGLVIDGFATLERRSANADAAGLRRFSRSCAADQVGVGPRADASGTGRSAAGSIAPSAPSPPR
jgi:hypothetical protein